MLRNQGRQGEPPALDVGSSSRCRSLPAPDWDLAAKLREASILASTREAFQIEQTPEGFWAICKAKLDFKSGDYQSVILRSFATEQQAECAARELVDQARLAQAGKLYARERRRLAREEDEDE